MNYFKVLFFVLVLAPVSVFATMVGDSEYGDLSVSYMATLEADFQSVMAGENEGYTTLGFLNASISDVIVTDKAKVNESDVFTTDFDVGIYTVSEDIAAISVSTRPVPATTWSISAGLLGLLTVGRRSKAKN